MQFLIGVDVGTSSCKAAIFDAGYHLKSFSTSDYAIDAPRPGWAEFDPDAIWRALCRAVRSALAGLQVDVRAHAFCMGFSVFGEGLVASNRHGDAACPGILASDLRSASVAGRLQADLGRDALYRRTGRTAHPMAVITKIIWLKENLPQALEPQTLFLDMHSWLQLKLGTGPVTDHTSASGTMLFDVNQKAWDSELLAYAGVAEGALPRSLPAGSLLGAPSAPAAAELGFADAGQVSVVVGAMDQACNAVGSGTVLPGAIVCSTSTVEAVTIVLDPDVHPQRLVDFNMPTVPSAVAGQCLTHIFLWDAGRSLAWFCSNFARKEKEDASAHNLSVFEEVLTHEPRARDVFFLPHLSGSGMPWQDATSRGAFLGLTATTDVVSAAHAIIEGVTFELKLNFENLESLGVALNELRVVGGGSKSDRWLQLKADVLGKPAARLQFAEAGCLGAAILAGRGVNLFDDLVTASRQIACAAESFHPREMGSDLHRHKYAIYKQIYPTLHELNRDISALTW